MKCLGLLVVGLVLCVSGARAGEVLKAGVMQLQASAQDLEKARNQVRQRCNELGLYAQVAGNKSHCLELAESERFSLNAAANCVKFSDAAFVACLEVSKGLAIPQGHYDVCANVREGDSRWSPRKECLRHLSVSSSSYNKKSFSECFRLFERSELETRSCLNMIRDRELSDHVVVDCFVENQKHGAASSTFEKSLACLDKETESAPLLGCNPQGIEGRTTRSGNPPPSRGTR
ncbi:hypothetical protein [Bdellovibrio bacteriovorus]|uniref:hypothetical protein n=1 Tax=Bdellovibrio bacteriovorus TaxID=959 RepID=UPI0035A66968